LLVPFPNGISFCSNIVKKNCLNSYFKRKIAQSDASAQYKCFETSPTKGAGPGFTDRLPGAGKAKVS
jgi:hypothetical protein